MRWKVETIPDNHFVYRRIPDKLFKEGHISPSAFNNQGDGMSVDWQKYSTPEKTRNIVSNQKKDPLEFGVAKIKAVKIREIEEQTLNHAPSKRNRAHSTVFGAKNVKIRRRFQQCAIMVIKPFEPNILQKSKMK